MRWPFLLAALAVAGTLPACSDATDVDGGGPGASGGADPEANGTGATDGSGGTGTGSIGASGSGDAGTGGTALASPVLDCPNAPMPCDVVDTSATGNRGNETLTESLRCALQALERIEQGAATRPLTLKTQQSVGDSPARTELVVSPDGSVLLQRHGSLNGQGAYREQLQECRLTSFELFTLCLAEGGPECIDVDAWVTGCGPTTTLDCPG